MFHERGDWFVAGDDHRSGEYRTFRVDRVETIERTGVFDEPDDDRRPAAGRGRRRRIDGWTVDGSLPRVTLRLDPSARWVIEQYPVDTVVERSDGRFDATFAVLSEHWLERLLLRAGTDAAVVAPSAYRHPGALRRPPVPRQVRAVGFGRSAAGRRGLSPATGRTSGRPRGGGGRAQRPAHDRTRRRRARGPAHLDGAEAGPFEHRQRSPPQVGGGPLRAGRGRHVHRVGLEQRHAVVTGVGDGGVEEPSGEAAAAGRRGDDEAHHRPHGPVVDRLQQP